MSGSCQHALLGISNSDWVWWLYVWLSIYILIDLMWDVLFVFFLPSFPPFLSCLLGDTSNQAGLEEFTVFCLSFQRWYYHHDLVIGMFGCPRAPQLNPSCGCTFHFLNYLWSQAFPPSHPPGCLNKWVGCTCLLIIVFAFSALLGGEALLESGQGLSGKNQVRSYLSQAHSTKHFSTHLFCISEYGVGHFT